MPTNVYFNNFPSSQITSEQLLIEDLVIESMKIHGLDVFYLPRSSGNEVDYIYGEDVFKQYTEAYPIEMYIENITGMDGEGDFVSKFGLEIRDEMQLLVSRRRFEATIPQLRPNEGDLIYIPLVQNFFEITFVEHENDQAMFYTLGRGRGGNVYVFALKMKQYVYSNEIIETGIDQIDDQIIDYYPKTTIALDNVVGYFTNREVVYQGTDQANATWQAIVHDFIPYSHLEVFRTQGKFIPNESITGVTSNATAIAIIDDEMIKLDDAFEDIVDNNRIKTESNTIIDWSEKNPFGET